MRALLLLLACWLAVPASGFSQKIKIDLTNERDHFLAGEPIRLAVKISNFSGRPLVLGLDNEWLSFTIIGPNRKPLDRLQELPVQGPFEVPSGAVTSRLYELTSSFDFTEPGPYAVTASVQVKDWNEAFRTAYPKKIELVRGIKLVEQEVGIPAVPGAPASPPESRRFALLQVRHNQQLYLYFRLADASGSKILRVFPLGPLVAFGRPEFQIDRNSYLHVLYQTSARTFTYCALNPNGDLFIRQSHEYVTNRPTFATDRVGDVLITGGRRRFVASDIPPSNMLTKPEDEAVEKPAPPAVVPSQKPTTP